MIAYLLILFVCLILCTIAFRRDLHFLTAVSAVLGFVAACIITVVIARSSSAGTGAYILYANGVRVSDGFLLVTQNFALFLIFGAIAVGGPMGLGSLIGGKMRRNDQAGKPSVLILILWTACLLLGIAFLGSGISGFIHVSGNRVFLVPNICFSSLGALMIGSGFFGIRHFALLRKAWKHRLSGSHLQE
ncbi:MAG: hypothetical protein J6P31_07415 [Oscillospiraceae bacterium]|nr:hypothetical protein [Oscillospiraceae bacterium]